MAIRSHSFHLVSLGCAKNLVDSNVLNQLLSRQGYENVTSRRQAEFILVNTCGFIHDARAESLAAIREQVDRKRRGQKVIVTGCLSQRYQQALLDEVPGIDGLIGTRNLQDILQVVSTLQEQRENTPVTAFSTRDTLAADPQSQYTLVQGGSSYLKIADGCHRTCAFCAIPLIKGGLVSRAPGEVIRDALLLQAAGVQEINLVAQDVTAYGHDRSERDALACLLEDLLPQIPSVPWVRLLYTFPGLVTDRLINLMASGTRLLPYLDIPLQHADPAVLKAMSRPSDVGWVRETIAKMRARIPGLVTRTTLIVGYPGENEQSFQLLREFVDEMQFDHLGVFTYSPEEGTAGFDLPDLLPQDVKEARRADLMQLQDGISLTKLQPLVRTELDMLVEGLDPAQHIAIGRTYRDAPEIDGLVVAHGDAELGRLVKVKITGAMAHDLYAEVN